MSASRHWIALDDAMSRLLPARGSLQARERFAHRAAALTDIYVAHIQKAIAAGTMDTHVVMNCLEELQLAHHALTAVLTGAWAKDQVRSRTNPPAQS